MMAEKSVLLNSGYSMPLLGLGCWQSQVKEMEAAVETALDAGYRHIDTAYSYFNEDGVGTGLKKWLQKGVNSRDDVFVVTKLPLIGMYQAGVEKFLKKSLDALKLEYVDLYLVHSPVGLKYKDDKDTFPMKPQGKLDIDVGTDLIAIWKEMEKMVDKGWAKSIGVSNFTIKQIKKVAANARIKPAVNQIELHVQFDQIKMQKFCKSRNIVITAYSPLGSPGRPPALQKDGEDAAILLNNPIVTLVAERHKVSNAQVLLRYIIQQKMVAIPKSSNPQRIKTNADVFSFNLSEVEMAALASLDKGEYGSVINWDAFPGMKAHPESPI